VIRRGRWGSCTGYNFSASAGNTTSTAPAIPCASTRIHDRLDGVEGARHACGESLGQEADRDARNGAPEPRDPAASRPHAPVAPEPLDPAASRPHAPVAPEPLDPAATVQVERTLAENCALPPAPANVRLVGDDILPDQLHVDTEPVRG
jgi:hypothetical protein